MEERGGGDLVLAGVEAVGEVGSVLLGNCREVAANVMQVHAHVTTVGLGEGLVYS